MIVSQLYEKAAFLCKDFLGSADATIGKPGKIFFPDSTPHESSCTS
jgi:hypothetical protein